jgi:hypothetical protein
MERGELPEQLDQRAFAEGIVDIGVEGERWIFFG